MNTFLIILSMVNLFLAGGLAMTVLIDIRMFGVQRRTYWNAIWSVVNIVIPAGILLS